MTIGVLWAVLAASALLVSEAHDCHNTNSCLGGDASDISPLLQTKVKFQSDPAMLGSSSLESNNSPSKWLNVALAGCQNVVSNTSHSSASCREGGQKGWGTSRMFQLQNAVYDKGALWVTGPSGIEAEVKQCFSGCSATWFPGCCPHVQVDDIDPMRQSAHPAFIQTGVSYSMPQFLPLLSTSESTQPSFKCSTEGWHESALVINRDSSLYQFNMYHYFIDSLFVGFVTASHMQVESGCSRQPAHIYVAGEDNLPRVKFDPIWESLFGSPLRNLSQAHGCYRKVIYGFMENQRFMHHPDSKNLLFRSPAMMPWMMSFSTNLRTVANATAVNADWQLVLASHPRIPPWIWDFKWEDYRDPSGELSATSPIVRHELHKLSVSDQIAVVSRARGMISAAGAAFVHQIFMPVQSAMLIITTPTSLWNAKDSNGQLTNGYPDCSMLPETWHESTALHLGNTAISWRTCFGAEDFRASQPLLMLQFLLERRKAAEKSREASICYVLHPAKNSTRPSCDTLVTMPLPNASSFSTCGSWSIGTPIDADDTWSSDAVNPKGI